MSFVDGFDLITGEASVQKLPTELLKSIEEDFYYNDETKSDFKRSFSTFNHSSDGI